MATNPETKLQKSIMDAVKKLGGICKLYRNNTGMAIGERGQRVHFGLCVGSSDLIGWRTVTVTQDMQGQKLAVFTAIELKAPKGKLTERQEEFLARVRDAGGIAGEARSLDEVLDLLGVER